MADASFTCNTCGVLFQQANFQREHMRTDWHRYNLKRRVAVLPPIPADVFAEKMIQQRNIESSIEESKGSRRQVTKKDLKRQEQARRRTEGRGRLPRGRADSASSGISHTSLGQPSRSDYDTDTEADSLAPVSETLENATLDEADEAQALVDEQEQMIQEKIANMVKIPANVSFMDGHVSDTVEDNVNYLGFKYGLVIPEPNYVSDLAGLVQYLNEKVGLGNCCLSCNFMGRSIEAARNHMIAKNHVKIPYDNDDYREELADFYDFSPAYANYGSAEWEDVSDEDFDEADEKIVLHPGEHMNTAVAGQALISADGYELQIAPGVNAGHRTLQRYYKQRYTGLPAAKQGQAPVKLIDYRSPGIGEKESAKMVKAQWRAEKKQSYSRMKHDKHINFQKHFRDELLQ